MNITESINNYLIFLKDMCRKSYILMSRYLLFGVYWIIVTVLVNRLELKELTYFNAVFSLMVFSEITSYGIASGISIFINQNIDNTNSIRKYIKLSTIMSFTATLAFILIILIFKDGIFSNFIKIEIYDDFLFLYMMLPVIFFNMLGHFMNSLLKVLQEFRYQFVTSAVQIFLILTNLFIIMAVRTLTLYSIAAIYLVSNIIYIFTMYYVFKNRLKMVSVDMLNMKDIELKNVKATILKVSSIGAKEAIWTIAYTLGALVLLNKSEILYNAYSYYENVLDIINGIYFALINVASITICNTLGRKMFDTAYKQAKYTVYTAIILWIVLVMAYMLFNNLIFMGMNKEIVETGKTIGLVYLLIQLFRYIDWTFNSYVIILGGKTTMPFVLDILALVYFSILFAMKDYITNDPYVLIYLVGLDSLVKLSINFFVFRRKNWMEVVAEE